MRKITNSIILSIIFALSFSCADESLDPYQLDKISKGTMLALRGDMFDNIYYYGLPGAEFFPDSITGEEIFAFDAEYLAENTNTLESFELFVVKRNILPDTIILERVSMMQVPFSEFKVTEDYARPWVSVSMTLEEILAAIGMTTPLDQASIDLLNTYYRPGINFEIDLTLTNGTQILADQMVSGSLFQSDQFYPAQKLTYTVTKYCDEDISGTYNFSTTVLEVGSGGNINGCDGPITGPGSLIPLSVGRYTISDASFGVYDCAYGDEPATGVNLSNYCDFIAFGWFDDLGRTFSMSEAAVSPDGTELSFNWENDHGDKGITVLTRTDMKLWPADLHSEE